MLIENYIWLVPALPLLGVIINTLLGLAFLRQHPVAHGAGHGDHGHGDHATAVQAGRAPAQAAAAHEPHTAHHGDHGARRSGLLASAMVGLAFGLTVLAFFQL